MKIDRLISIIMILNNKERVTAKELSKKFDVSIKTIQRDIETIEMAGIPIVSYKGHEGGYEIIEGYRVNKASMTKNEVALLKNLLDGINETYRNKDVFFEEIVRERAVELAFEGQRFDDLRRWNRNYDPRYLEKTAIDFDRGEDGKPINVRERVVIKRAVSKKHNWVPIQTKYTTQYSGFPQNPGW